MFAFIIQSCACHTMRTVFLHTSCCQCMSEVAVGRFFCTVHLQSVSAWRRFTRPSRPAQRQRGVGVTLSNGRSCHNQPLRRRRHCGRWSPIISPVGLSIVSRRRRPSAGGRAGAGKPPADGGTRPPPAQRHDKTPCGFLCPRSALTFDWPRPSFPVRPT